MHSMTKMGIFLSTAAAFAVPSATEAAQFIQTGSSGGLSYQARSLIVGVTSTDTIAGGGDPIYLSDNRHRGTVGLLMDFGAGGRFVCSGSLSANRTAIITAGHCVSDGGSARPESVTAFFYDGNAADDSVYGAGAAGVTTVNIGHIHVNEDYTGEVIDQNDIAVLKLDGEAPAFAQGYELYTGGDLTGEQFNVAGYGVRSDTGGDAGGNLGTGRLRQGDNRYDFAFGDADFGGFFDGGPAGFFGTADVEFSYVSDFDNGLAANDASCLIGGAFGLGGAKYCDLGVGALEVGIDGGDSGGPQFINGQLAGVNSYGLSFGETFGDIDGGLNSSFGEFSGYVPTFIHSEWIGGVVPEPSTWAMMIFGFGMTGAALRRRKKLVKVSYA